MCGPYDKPMRGGLIGPEYVLVVVLSIFAGLYMIFKAVKYTIAGLQSEGFANVVPITSTYVLCAVATALIIASSVTVVKFALARRGEVRHEG